jgi:hypothetical protein
VNTHSGQRGLLHQLSPMCTFDVGIVAMAHSTTEDEMKTDRTVSERVARYVAAAPDRGLVRVCLWVPKTNADELKAIAALMREQHRSTESNTSPEM